MNLNGKIDTHFAFAILILVAALLAFSFWMIHESDKDNALYDAIGNAATKPTMVKTVDEADKGEAMEERSQVGDPILSETVVEDISADVDVDLGTLDELSDVDGVTFDDLDF